MQFRRSTVEKLRQLIREGLPTTVDYSLQLVRNEINWIARITEKWFIVLYDVTDGWQDTEVEVTLRTVSGETPPDGIYLAMRWAEDGDGLPVYVTGAGFGLGCGLKWVDGVLQLDTTDGLEFVEDESGCHLRVKTSCPLVIDVDGAVTLDPTALGDGLELVTGGEDCTLSVATGCGIAVDEESGVILLDPSIAGLGLQFNPECDISVNPGPGLGINDSGQVVPVVGCGVEVVSSEIRFKASDAAGSGLTTEGTCGLAVNVGCGIEISADTVRVKSSDLAGAGLTTSGTCGLAVNPGCGIEISADTVRVKSSDLAGAGLTTSGTCTLAVNPGDGIEIVADQVQARLGCGLEIVASEIAVDNGDLAGFGLEPGSGCLVDIDVTEIDGPQFTVLTDVNIVFTGGGAYLRKSVTRYGIVTTPIGLFQGLERLDVTDVFARIDVCRCGEGTEIEIPGCDPPGCVEVTPDITNGAVALFGTYPAGSYDISFVSGALCYNKDLLPSPLQWFVHYNTSSLPRPDGHFRYMIVHSGGAETLAPGNSTQYGTPALCSAANAGLSVTISHSGGTIGVYLEDDPYSDNARPGKLTGVSAPTFRLCYGTDSECSLAGSGDIIVEGSADFHDNHSHSFTSSGEVIVEGSSLWHLNYSHSEETDGDIVVEGESADYETEITRVFLEPEGEVIVEGLASFATVIDRVDLSVQGDVIVEGDSSWLGNVCRGTMSIAGDVIVEGDSAWTSVTGSADSKVQSTSSTSNGGPMPGTTVLTLNWPASTTTGNLLVAALGSNDTSGGFTVPSGWTLAGSLVANTPNVYQTAIYYKENATSQSSVSFTTAFSATAPPFSAAIIELSGCVTSSSLDKTATAAGTSGAMFGTVPSGTTAATSQANEVLIAGLGMHTTTASTGAPTNTFTQAEKTSSGTQPTQLVLAYRDVTATAAYDTSVAISNVGYACEIATFKKA